MNDKKLYSAIQEAITLGYQKPDNNNNNDLGVIHRQMSKEFVEALAKELRHFYSDSESIRVLSKHYENKEQRLELGMNELLFDILVCECDSVLSSSGHHQLTYVKKAIWQIESELARNSREALYDFNKLVLGSSENQLFIGSITDDPTAYIQTLLPAARHCNANLYLALVPHPDSWNLEKKSNPMFWKFNGEGWDELNN